MKGLGTVILLATLGLMSTTTQAKLISYGFNFVDSNISGNFAYDDTTGQPFTNEPTITAYVVAELFVEWEDPVSSGFGTQTWDENDWDNPYVPPSAGVLVDQVGTVALLGKATNGDGLIIDFFLNLQGGGEIPYIITDQVAIDPRGFNRAYSASAVPAPNAVSLVLLGLASLGMMLRRKNKALT